MLQYDRIDFSENIGVNKAIKSKKYLIFLYWYLLDLMTLIMFSFYISMVLILSPCYFWNKIKRSHTLI